jgi:hypothetical protein
MTGFTMPLTMVAEHPAPEIDHATQVPNRRAGILPGDQPAPASGDLGHDHRCRRQSAHGPEPRQTRSAKSGFNQTKKRRVNTVTRHAAMGSHRSRDRYG